MSLIEKDNAPDISRLIKAGRIDFIKSEKVYP